MTIGTTLAVGIIEGFFGRPWGWAARQSAVEFLRKWDYQFYIYAPKADPFLRRRWREPIPSETMQHLADLKERCRRNGIALGLGLSPFEIYLNYNAEAARDLQSKVRQINEVGAETLCILFDDMQGHLDKLAEQQGRVISDICNWSTAKTFIVCPTYYSDDPRLTQQFGSAPAAYLQDLGRMVDTRVEFFWTGEKVISHGYSQQHLADISSKIGRKPFIWDNSIANDSKTRVNFLFLDPSAGWELSIEQVAGFAVNPMNQPYLSRIALAGYQLLLSGARGILLSDAAYEVCGRSFADRLLEDAHLLQTRGLAGLGSEARAALLGRYACDAGNPYAQEISSWLRGEYAFDPQCLTD
jgi:hyaluronoglucosaminidase